MVELRLLGFAGEEEVVFDVRDVDEQRLGSAFPTFADLS